MAMLAIDMHLDLSMNALSWNRDLRLSVAEMRRLEQGMTQKGRAASTVSFPEMRAANLAVSSATLIARVQQPGSDVSGYRHPDIAYGIAQGQLAYYRLLEADGVVRIIADVATLDQHLAEWEERGADNTPLGFIISMEGADPIVSPDQVGEWWDAGLRIVSLAHYGPSGYAHGTGTPGPLSPRGRPLLRAMEEVGMILDVTHLADESFFQAVESFGGPLLASHTNCRVLVPGDRQFTDEMIQLLVDRDAVIGAVMDAWMLYPGYVRGETPRELIGLKDVVDHIDHVCQVAGSSRHAAIGTDLDGGYGTEQCPSDLDTIVDIQKIPDLLRARGYSDDDVANIMHGNWLRLLRRSWSTA
jgi:membrane dipeptidase